MNISNCVEARLRLTKEDYHLLLNMLNMCHHVSSLCVCEHVGERGCAGLGVHAHVLHHCAPLRFNAVPCLGLAHSLTVEEVFKALCDCAALNPDSDGEGGCMVARCVCTFHEWALRMTHVITLFARPAGGQVCGSGNH